MPSISLSIVRAVIIGCALIATPVTAQKVDYDARFPAKNREAAKLTNVAVLPFRGTDGDLFTSALVSALQSSTLDGRPYFSVKTLDGMNYTPPAPPKGKRSSTGLTPAAETANAVRMGQKLGVAAIYTGEVVSAAISRRNYTETEEVCASKNSDEKCNYQTRQIACTDTTVNYSVIPRLVNVSNGQVVYSSTVTMKDNYDVCDGRVKFKGSLVDAAENIGKSIGAMFKRTEKRNPNEREKTPGEITTDEDLVSKVRNDVAEAIRYDVSPYNFKMTVEFKQKAPELPKDDQVKFRSASEFAKSKRLDRACSDWESLNTPANTNSINLLFNLGVCQEVLVPEEPNTALIFLAKADGLTSKPDPMINKALERVRKMVDAQTEITRQLKR